jgi:hypothetical protein
MTLSSDTAAGDTTYGVIAASAVLMSDNHW